MEEQKEGTTKQKRDKVPQQEGLEKELQGI
jgi:hypothetical protein